MGEGGCGHGAILAELSHLFSQVFRGRRIRRWHLQVQLPQPLGHHDGYPTGAAWRFAEALREAPEPDSFLVAFLITQPNAEPIQSPEQAADAEYRYLVQLVSDAARRLQVQCWRRIPGGDSWNPRCGPMSLVTFIRRFLPGGTSD